MHPKIKTRQELKNIIKNLGSKTIVHTNGTYDLIHIGHIYTLKKAKQLGDILIVSINSDNSVKRLKGKDRPIMSQKQRAELLASIEYVDYVTIFPEDNILETLNILKPDIQAKGGSFVEQRIREEKELVESWKGKFVSFLLLDGISTTDIIDKIKCFKR